MTPKLEDVKVDRTEKHSPLDLEKVYGKKIKRIEGHVSAEFGRDTLVFQLSSIVFEDGSEEFVEGEHDHPYLPADDGVAATLKALYEEENGPEES